MKKRAFITIWLILLMTFVGCSPSDLPSGAYPKQAGSFKLVDGPISRPEHKETDSPKTYFSEYQSAGGSSLAHTIYVYRQADRAEKEYAELKNSKKDGILPGETFRESGNKSIHVRSNEMMDIKWVCGSSLCEVASRDHEAALQLADSLPYK
ncbi:MAG: hypothetical protein M3384_13310 [Acidobacteriota bacterium]|nr:hypothetical protein [Acidobacteriota bacterium]